MQNQLGSVGDRFVQVQSRYGSTAERFFAPKRWRVPASGREPAAELL
ncbi:hypothetical protein [Aureliella helgolandensis]|nr:hypothetical protein [Aureliella helgolandensis]